LEPSASLLGWVDLWKGILLCADNPELHCISMPKLMAGIHGLEDEGDPTYTSTSDTSLACQDGFQR